MTDMRAIGFTQNLPIADEKSFIEFFEPKPTPSGHDILVKVIATSVNPVDTGVRRGTQQTLSTPKVIGWDAYGVVDGVGEAVTLFHSGDRVFL